MIPTLVFLALMAQEPQAVKPVKPATPGALISKALVHYKEAQSLRGSIRLIQTAKDQSGSDIVVEIATDLAVDKPSKFVIRQAKKGGDANRFVAVSNGIGFAYSKPKGVLGPDFFVEEVLQHGVSQKVADMYRPAARGLLDRSEVLDTIFAETRDDFSAAVSHWTALRFAGKLTLRNTEGTVIEGEYAEILNEDATGTFQLVISDSGDILRYVVKNRYAVPNQPGQTVDVLSTWDVDVKTGVKNDDSLYKLKK